MTILRQRLASCVMGHSPEADLNKKSASHARSRLPGNNFFLLIGRSATPAPHACGLACRSLSFSPASHWLLANDSSLPSCARAALYEYCMRSLAFLVLIIWIGASGERAPRRVHEHTGWWHFCQRPQPLDRDCAPLKSDKDVDVCSRQDVLREAEGAEDIGRVPVLRQRQK